MNKKYYYYMMSAVGKMLQAKSKKLTDNYTLLEAGNLK